MINNRKCQIILTMKTQSLNKLFLLCCWALLLPLAGTAQCYSGTSVSGNGWDYATFGGTAGNPATGTYIVEQGNTLILHHDDIHFGQGAVLVVQEGGVLNASFTTFQADGEDAIWGGIRLENNNANEESRFNADYCTIKNAYIGIQIGCGFVPSANKPMKIDLNWVHFINPVEYGIWGLPTETPGGSVVDNCRFNYDKDQLGHWNSVAFPTMVHLDQHCAMTVSGSEFINDMDPATNSSAARGIAVLADGCSLLLNDNTLKYWNTGIRILGQPVCNLQTDVLHSRIKNCFTGMDLTDQDNVDIIGNSFIMNLLFSNTYVASLNNPARMTGLKVGGKAAEITVENNTFRHREIGQGSSVDEHEYTGLELDEVRGMAVRGNDFELQLLNNRNNLNAMVRINDENLSTFFTCNNFDFDAGRTNGQFGWWLATSDSEIPTQGSNTLGTGNQWSTLAACGGASWHIVCASGAKAFDYHQHSSAMNPTCVTSCAQLTSANNARNCGGSSKQAANAATMDNTTFEAFPNPTDGKLTVQTSSADQQPQLLDARGQSLGIPMLRTGETRWELNLSKLVAGMYLLRAGSGVKRIVLR